MAHFAKLDENNVVLQVTVINNIEMLAADGSESEMMGVAFLIRWSGGYSNWKQTSYNTIGGQHPEGRPFRKNYAGLGYTYDSARDAFIPQQTYPSWVLNEETCQWDAPVAMPTDGQRYYWDEATTSWVAQPTTNV
jgi:hypothetical protein